MFFITQIEYTKDGQIIEYCRGYFKSFLEAENIVINNKIDFLETRFDYIVIEFIPEGLHQAPISVTWYKYNKRLDKYKKIERPRFAKHLSGFILG